MYVGFGGADIAYCYVRACMSTMWSSAGAGRFELVVEVEAAGEATTAPRATGGVRASWNCSATVKTRAAAKNFSRACRTRARFQRLHGRKSCTASNAVRPFGRFSSRNARALLRVRGCLVSSHAFASLSRGAGVRSTKEIPASRSVFRFCAAMDGRFDVLLRNQ